MSEKVNIFISHITEEQGEATKAKEYLDQVFKENVEVFVASSWTSIAPGEDWFKCISDAIEKADIMIVYCSGDSVGRAWVQFETGAGWFAKKTRVIPVCHKGMTPAALPEPIRRLQAVDINAATEGEQLKKLAEAVKSVANLPEPTPMSVESLPLASKGAAMPSLKGWILRPAAHIGEKMEGNFAVSGVRVADPVRAVAAGIDPKDSIFIRLLVEPPTGQFVNAMAQGKVAALFERDEIEGEIIIANLRLAASYQALGPDDHSTPLIVLEGARIRPK
jgi:hypothetical protein